MTEYLERLSPWLPGQQNFKGRQVLKTISDSTQHYGFIRLDWHFNSTKRTNIVATKLVSWSQNVSNTLLRSELCWQ